jgi:trans-aconitate methyltransferase
VTRGTPTPPSSTPRWDADLYAANTAHHRRHDDDFLRGVTLRSAARVLDLGCGVGDLTARLAQLTGGEVLGVDADADMVATARQRATSARIRFAVGRAQDLDRLLPARSVDVVVSVAVLHWVPAADHPRVLAQVRRVLRRQGVFRAEFGGSGQIAAVHELLDEESARVGGRPAGWYFPSEEDYRPLLADAGFAVPAHGWVRLLRQRRPMPDDRAFLGWLRSQVLVAYDPVVPAEAVRRFRRSAEERALAELRRADGSYDQDYVRLDLLAVPH